jgi:type III secretory pathway component EscR
MKNTTTSKGKKNTTTKVEVVQKVKKAESVNYLKEGVKGKDLMKKMWATNANIKENRRTFSQCLKEAKEQALKDKTFADIPAFLISECTPANLIPLRNEKRTVEGAGWSP